MSVDARQAKAIFLEAVERHPPEQWPAFLDRACAGQPELRRRVEELLGAHREAGTAPHQPVAEGPTPAARTVPEPADGPGTLIGPYKLLEQIGEGGMGTVWMAQQTQPVRRLVAIKLIKAGMDSRQVIARFEAERQALALMDHPHIAKVHDAGTTPDGRPFFVMELVKGVPITRYCDDKRLTPRQRLELFLPVCQALQHAHQKGIIHRDVKPSNVLVALYDDRPVPKVIDFGVAKATGQQLTEQTLHTGFGAVVGTLEYMSPEQANFNALDVDTRSDIYSLGVLLYELLAGSPPFSREELEKAGVLELLRVIREQEPSKPSTKLSTAEGLPTLAANRGTEPAKLTKLVRGELDWIVMKALEKDRGRRYETANGFAMDVQRYLADEPVLACPPSTAYKVRKFARKNKRLLLAAAAFALLLAVGSVVSTWQAIRATRAEAKEAQRADAEREARLEERAAKERESQALVATKQALNDVEAQRRRAEANFAKALAVVDDYLTKVSESQLLKTPGMQLLRRELLASALKFYDEFLQERVGDPTIRAELALAYYRVARVQFDFGAKKEANEAIRQAVALLEQLVKDNPQNLSYKADLARSYHLAGNYTQAIALGKELVAANPTNERFRRELAEAYNSLGSGSANGSKEQLNAYRDALTLREALVRESPDDPDAQAALGGTLNNLGVVLGKQNRLAEARDMYLRAVEHGQIACEKAPWNILHGKFLAIQMGNVATMQRQLNQNGEALRWCERALSVRKQLAENNPAVPSLWEDLFNAYQTIAGFQRSLDHPTEAARWQRQTRDAIERIPREDAGNLYLLARARARCAESIGWAKNELTSAEKAEQQHDADLAMDALHKAVAAGLKDVGKLNKDLDFAVLRERRDYKALLVKLAASAGQAATALTAKEVSSLVAEQKKQVADDPDNRQLQADLAASQHALALIQFGQGKMDEAQKHFDQAVILREALVQAEPKNAQFQADLTASGGYHHLVHARRLTDQKRPKEAKAALAKIEGFPFNDAQAYRERGRTYFALGQADKAVTDFHKAVALSDGRARELLASPPEPAASEADKLLARLADDALLAQLTAAVERNPDDTARRWLRGEWYARHRRWKEAAADFQHFLGRQPLDRRSVDDAWHWAFAAPTLVAAGDREGYRRLCDEMLKRFGDTEEPYTADRIAKAYLLLPASGKDTDLACQLADRAVTLGKKSGELWFIFCKGLADYRRGNDRAAAEALAPLVSGDPGPFNANCRLVLAMASHRQGEPEAARQHLMMAAKLLDQYVSDPARFPVFPGTPRYQSDWLIAWLLHREAQTLIEHGVLRAQGKLKELIAECRKAIELDPKDVGAHRSLAFALKDQKSLDEAAAEFRRVIELAPKDAAAHNDLGLVLKDQKKLDEASAEIRRAVELAPKDAGTHLHLGSVLEEQGDLPGALAAYQNVIAICPAISINPDFAEKLPAAVPARYYILLGQWDKAAAEYAKADLLGRALGDDAFAYACLLLIRGDREGYDKFCRAMIQRAGRTKDHFEAFVLARTCAMGRHSPADHARAVEWGKQAVTGAQPAWYFHALGLAQYRAGQFDQALQSFAKASVETWAYRDLNWFGQALVHHRLGHPEETQQCLDKGIQWLERYGSPGPGRPANIHPIDWVGAQALRREAEDLIHPKPKEQSDKK